MGGEDDPRTIDDASGAIDWNGDGDATDVGFALDLDGDGSPAQLSPGSVFKGFDDWDNLVFVGGSIGAPGSTAPPPPPAVSEPPRELDAEIFAALGPPAPTKLKGEASDSQNVVTWKPVELLEGSRYGNAKDRMVEVRFAPVEAREFRIEVKLREGFSAGVLEWQLGS